MSEKAEETQQRILTAALTAFSTKGYAKTSMKDICDATGLSRGGLYRHYGSTREIFMDLLEGDKNKTEGAIRSEHPGAARGEALFNAYLDASRASIFSSTRGLYFAVHEFAFIEPEIREFLQDRYKAAASMLKSILSLGQKEGSFRLDFDSEEMAVHILFLIDSFQTTSAILEMPEEKIDKQIDVIRCLVLKT